MTPLPTWKGDDAGLSGAYVRCLGLLLFLEAETDNGDLLTANPCHTTSA